MSCHVECFTRDNVASVYVHGKWNFTANRDFAAAYQGSLDNPAIQKIEVVLAKTNYMDSSALGMLLLLRDKTRAAGKLLCLKNPAGPVASVLRAVNFERIFTIENARDVDVGWA